MKDKYESLNSSLISNNTKCNKISTLINDLIDLYPDNFSDVKIKINTDLLSLRRKAKKISKEIEEIRNNCEHNYVSDGYDSHRDYFICSKCGNTY